VRTFHQSADLARDRRVVTPKRTAHSRAKPTSAPDRPDQYHRTAVFVDGLLKGANPADLPVEQPTKFALFINSTTVKALGVESPQSMLLRADEVIG
jgi:ABC-type uncharacterized transport system substrate-binding protein